MPDVTVVTVAYASMAVLPGMAGSLPQGTPLVVVNNGPDDGLTAWAKARGVILVDAKANLGFGAACNLGAKSADSAFLLFLNPDARLGPDAVTGLLAAAARFPRASAFGPVMEQDGRVQFKRRSYLNRAETAPRDPGAEPCEVPSLSGAAMLVRSAAFHAVGGFDPRIFLYYEDDDLALRLRRDVGPLMLVPGVRITHFSGKSSAPSAELSRFKGYHWARSRIYVGRKHGLAFPWAQGLKNAAWHLVRPRAWRSAEQRAEAFGRLAGVFSCIRG